MLFRCNDIYKPPQQVAIVCDWMKTLMEMCSGKPASDYDMLRMFGCSAYYHVSDGKLEPRARKIVFLEFKRGVKGYKLWDSKD